MSTAVNVLHTRVVTGSGGGPDKTILRSGRYLDPSRYRLAAGYLYPANDLGIETLRRTAQANEMPFHAIPERGVIDRRALRMMLDLCRRLHIDIWHSHDYKTDLLGLLLRRYHPMKLVTTVHGFTRETWRTRLYAKLNDLAFLGYDKVIAVSPPLVRYCAQRGANPDRLAYVPNGIVLDEYRRQRSTAEARAELSINTPGPHLAVVSRFSPEKGVDRAIELLPKLVDRDPHTTLHLIGDGPGQQQLRELAARIGVSGRIRWWGWQTQTRPILEAMDALLLTSHTEGLPNAVLEAMAVGLPVAATRVGAVPEVLDQGGCGVLLSDEVAAWAEQVRPLLLPTFQREQMIATARDRLGACYDFERRMRRIEAIYAEVCDIKPAALNVEKHKRAAA